MIEALLAAAPEGAQTTDVYGRLPLHYAVDKAKPDLAVVEALLAAFPAGGHLLVRKFPFCATMFDKPTITH